ncbi:MAG: DUF697 domain-containing protein [Ferruginibacter sp.]|nr:DUF697 domain-containing protein [Cytophagales bacterium]
MRQQIKFLLLAVGSLVLLAFVLFVFNQVAQVYLLARAVSPALGGIVLGGLVLLFTVLFVTPVILYYRLPRALVVPVDESGKTAYVQQLGRRLARNRLLQGTSLDYHREADLQKALGLLHARADVLIQNTAKSVFLTTAISQNGKLDALTVFVTHSKMVWDVAHVYYQRPAPRDLIALYANVGATTFLATQIEDLDISEQLEPVIGTVLQNSVLKSVPIVSSLSSVILDSLLEGTVNAFLTLRVGILTKQYCGSLEPFEAGKARKAAYREASGLLRTLVVQTSGQVVSAMVRATKKAGADTVKSGVVAAGQATSRVRNVLTGWVSRTKKVE